MKKVVFLSLILIACQPDTKHVVTNLPGSIITQNCSVVQESAGAVITCPDGTTVTLPPNVVVHTEVETVEIPVVVEVERLGCHYDNGNHYGQDPDHEGNGHD